MGIGLSNFARKALWSSVAIAISIAGFNSVNAQQYFNQGQVQQNGCCSSCQQIQCRCRPGIQFVNPNQFLCEPQWQDPCLPGSGSTMYPPSGIDPSYSQPNTGQPGTQPGTQPGAQPGTQPFNPGGQGGNNSNALAFGEGGGGEGMGFRDAMIGDFFGGGGFVSGPSWNGVSITSPLTGGDRRYKLTEATSPIPTDRVFVNYNMFKNAVTDANGNELNLNRYAFGLEKTFYNENVSLELRLPIVDGVNSRQIQVVGGPPNRNTEFGNVSLTTKFLLAERNGWAYSTGLGVIFPTANSAFLISDLEESDPVVAVEFANEAYYVQPFFAVQRSFNSGHWINFYTQCDFATEGNTISVRDINGQMLSSPQIYNDQNLLFFDLSMGRWLYRTNEQNRRLRGVAAIFEVHYTTSLNDADVVTAGFDGGQSGSSDTLTNSFNRLDVLNSTLGMRFLVGPKSTLTVAGVVPLRTNEEHLFDSEISVQFSRRR